MRFAVGSIALALGVMAWAATAGTPDSTEVCSAKPAGNVVVPVQQSRLALLRGTLRELTVALSRGKREASWDHTAVDRRLEAAENLDSQLDLLEAAVSSRPGAGQPSRMLGQQVDLARLQVARMALMYGAMTGQKARFQKQDSRGPSTYLPPPGPTHTAAQARLLLRTSRTASVDELMAAAAGISRAHLPTADGKPQTTRQPGKRPLASTPATTVKTATGPFPQPPDRRPPPRRGLFGVRWPWQPRTPSSTPPATPGQR